MAKTRTAITSPLSIILVKVNEANKCKALIVDARRYLFRLLNTFDSFRFSGLIHRRRGVRGLGRRRLCPFVLGFISFFYRLHNVNWFNADDLSLGNRHRHRDRLIVSHRMREEDVIIVLLEDDTY